MTDFNVLCLRYSTGVAIAQFSSASQKEKPSENDIFNQLYLHYYSLTSTLEHSYVFLIRQRFYPTRLKYKKGSLVRFHTTAQKLRNNFPSDFLLCASIDYNRYRTGVILYYFNIVLYVPESVRYFIIFQVSLIHSLPLKHFVSKLCFAMIR